MRSLKLHLSFSWAVFQLLTAICNQHFYREQDYPVYTGSMGQGLNEACISQRKISHQRWIHWSTASRVLQVLFISCSQLLSSVALIATSQRWMNGIHKYEQNPTRHHWLPLVSTHFPPHVVEPQSLNVLLPNAALLAPSTPVLLFFSRSASKSTQIVFAFFSWISFSGLQPSASGQNICGHQWVPVILYYHRE